MIKAPMILIIDDEEKILELVQSYLNAAGFETLCARNGKTALAFLETHKIDFVLLDLMLPDLSGEEICKKIRAPAPAGFDLSVPVIMLTAKVDEASIIHGLNIGADDYITKPFSPRELAARVKAALRRHERGVPENRRFEGRGETYPRKNNQLIINTENRTVIKNGEEINLTTKEYKILSLLAGRPEKIFTRDEIIERALGEDFDGFDRAVDTHIKKLRAKIKDDPKTPQYILTVYGMGYRFKND
ncbi:DNA-binding response regulator [Spirochaetia bacterium]|nr:DNA-binding response regulator [Spirochaetia bacterium]